MKKNLILIFVMLLFPGFIKAQRYLLKVVDESCSCLQTKLHLINDSSSFNSMGIECLQNAAIPFKKEIRDDFESNVDEWGMADKVILDNNRRTMVYLFNGMRNVCPMIFTLAEQAVESYYEKKAIPWQDTVLRSVQLAMAGKFDEAHKILDRMQNQRLFSAYLFYIEGHMYMYENRYVAAINSFDRGFAYNPNALYCLFEKGRAYQAMGKGHWEEAIKTYNQVLEKKPDAAEVYYHRGYIYVNKSKWNQALEDLQKATGSVEYRGRAYVLMAVCLENTGRLQEGIMACDSSLYYEPVRYATHHVKGQILALNGNIDLACEELNLAKKNGISAAQGDINRYCK